MLERIDIDSIFANLKTQGYAHAEIFAETTYVTRAALRSWKLAEQEGRIDQICHQTAQGLCVRAWGNRPSAVFSTNEFSTRAVLDLLEEKTTRHVAAPARPAHPGLQESTMKLLGAIARVFCHRESEGILNPCLEYTEKVRHFEVVSPDGAPQRGTETEAQAIARWHTRAAEENRFELHRVCASPSAVLIPLEKELQRATRHSLSWSRAWPAPSGEIPIVWSPRAVAELVALFLKGFEGDRVLKGNSFLTSLEQGLKVAFHLQESPDVDTLACDHEGAARRQLTLLRNGQARALACNREIAGLLEVPPTGHGRRDSYQAEPTVAFWNPTLVPHARVPHLLETVRKGIAVETLVPLAFAPETGSAQLRLLDARLIHEGEQGEWVAPITLSLNLIDWVQALTRFEEISPTTGVRTLKKGQRFLTEVTAPAALTESMPLPGTVPQSHYW